MTLLVFSFNIVASRYQPVCYFKKNNFHFYPFLKPEQQLNVFMPKEHPIPTANVLWFHFILSHFDCLPNRVSLLRSFFPALGCWLLMKSYADPHEKRSAACPVEKEPGAARNLSIRFYETIHLPCSCDAGPVVTIVGGEDRSNGEDFFIRSRLRYGDGVSFIIPGCFFGRERVDCGDC